MSQDLSASLPDDAPHLRQDRSHIGQDLARAGRQPQLAVVGDEHIVARVPVEQRAHGAVARRQGVLPFGGRLGADGPMAGHQGGDAGGRRG